MIGGVESLRTLGTKPACSSSGPFSSQDKENSVASARQIPALLMWEAHPLFILCRFSLQAPRAPLTRLIGVWTCLYSPQYPTQHLLYKLEGKGSPFLETCLWPPICLQQAGEKRGKQRTRWGPLDRGPLPPRCSNIPNWGSLLRCFPLSPAKLAPLPHLFLCGPLQNKLPC